VSDAAVHPNGTGTCAWVIWANAEVWSGEGYVPGPVMDMYSGLAEVYGIYTMLSFFSAIPVTLPNYLSTEANHSHLL